jgi:hypothetical protein
MIRLDLLTNVKRELLTNGGYKSDCHWLYGCDWHEVAIEEGDLKTRIAGYLEKIKNKRDDTEIRHNSGV